MYQYEPACEVIEGALHALLELHWSADILTEDAAQARLTQYPLLVIPELTRIPEHLLSLVRQHVEAGGHLIISGAHVAQEYGSLVGAEPAGEPLAKGVCLPVDGEAVPVGGLWQPVRALDGTDTIVTRLTHQEPGKDHTDQVLVTRRRLGRGSVLAIHGPIFGGFLNYPHPMLRRLIGNMLKMLPVEPLVKAQDASPRLEIVLRQRDQKLLVNLINRGPAIALPPKRILIEEIEPLRDIRLTIRRPTKPKAVSMVPEGKIEWSYADGQVTVRVDELAIHGVIVVE